MGGGALRRRLTLGMAVAGALVLAACVIEPAPQSMDFSAFTQSDRARIVDTDRNSRVDAREVTDPAQVAALYRAVADRPDGWHRPWPGSPQVRWQVTFSRAGREVGGYGVGANFIAYDGFVRNLAGSDLRSVLALVQARLPAP